MKGDGTISGAASRREHGPSGPRKSLADEPIMPFINTASTSVLMCVCVAPALIKLFMTELIGIIEDIKITCQRRAPGRHVQLTAGDERRVGHGGVSPNHHRERGGQSNLMWTGFTGQSERLNGAPVGGALPLRTALMESPLAP